METVVHSMQISDLLDETLRSADLPPAVRSPIHGNRFSGVERLTFPDGTTAIYKYGAASLETEDRMLRAARDIGLPVPQILASSLRDGAFGLVLEDLGDAVRQARDSDAILAASSLHRSRTSPLAPVVDEKSLADLPALALGHLHRLEEAGRWRGHLTPLRFSLSILADVAGARAVGAGIPPFGWTHSRFSGASLHIRRRSWHLLELGDAVTGPSLLDLAAWRDNSHPFDPKRLHWFIQAYVAAGGDRDALRRRGGLAPEVWALGWHQLRVAERLIRRAGERAEDPGLDYEISRATRRRVTMALWLFKA